MQIKVYTIDVRFPRWLKRALVFGAIPAAVLLGTVHYLRADVTVPNAFADGDTLSAARLNENFTALQTAMNSLAGTVATSAVPPGTVVAYGGENVPAGWLLCDGAAIDRTTYAALFGAIGVAHGGGNGTTTFNLPDYRGRFLRGVSAGTSNDPDTASRGAPQAGSPTVTGGYGNTGNSVGSVQQWATGLPAGLTMDTQGAHAHTIAGGAYGAAGAQSPGTGFAGGTSYRFNAIVVDTAGAHAHTISGGDSETRPANVYVNYLIKY